MLYLWKIVLLFVVLTPGILLTIPPVGKKIFGSGKSNFTAACVHAVIFVVLLNLFNVEGFQDVPSMPKRPIVASVNTSNLYNDVVNARNSIIKTKAMLQEQQNHTTEYSENANMARIMVDTKSEEIRVATMEAEDAKRSYEDFNKKFEEANNGIAEKLALLSQADAEFRQKLALFNESVKKDQEAAQEKARVAAALVKAQATAKAQTKAKAQATTKAQATAKAKAMTKPTVVMSPSKALPKVYKPTGTSQPQYTQYTPEQLAANAEEGGPPKPTATTSGSVMGNLLNAVGLAPPSAKDARGQPIVIQNNYICNGVRGWVKTADPAIVVLWVEESKEQQSFAPQTCVPA